MVEWPGARRGCSVSKVKWLPAALSDIERLHKFLYAKNPEAAARAAGTILDGAELLKSSPHLGRPMPDDTGRRELIIPFAAGAYVLRYMLEEEDTVVIIRVWHSRENRNLLNQ
jgi:plasmid stabilization system protein ParE